MPTAVLAPSEPQAETEHGTPPVAGEKPVIVRRAILLVVAALAVAALAAGLLLPAGDDAPGESADRAVDITTDRGGRAPTIDLPALDGSDTRVSLPDGRPTVLYFFASWCVPCAKELPIVKEVAAERADVAFLGVDHLDQADDGREFLARFDVDIPTGHDPGGDVALAYKLRGLPATVFIGADGRIVSTLHGQLDRATLIERIDDLVLQRRKS